MELKSVHRRSSFYGTGWSGRCRPIVNPHLNLLLYQPTLIPLTTTKTQFLPPVSVMNLMIILILMKMTTYLMIFTMYVAGTLESAQLTDVLVVMLHLVLVKTIFGIWWRSYIRLNPPACQIVTVSRFDLLLQISLLKLGTRSFWAISTAQLCHF